MTDALRKNEVAWGCVLLTLCLVTCFTAPVFAVKDAATTPAGEKGKDQTVSDPGWTVKQNSSTVGQLTIYVSTFGIKAINRAQGINTIATAPDWTVEIVNDEKKSYFECPLAKWKGLPLRRLFIMYGLDVSQFQLKKIRSAIVCGHKASLYLAQTEHAHKERIQEITLKASVAEHDQYNAERVKEFWVADDVSVPPKAMEVLCKIYGITVVDKLPLSLVFLENNLPKKGLETLSCQQTSVARDSFKIPADYKKVSSESAVMMDFD